MKRRGANERPHSSDLTTTYWLETAKVCELGGLTGFTIRDCAARGRVGIPRPLYYSRGLVHFTDASELTALRHAAGTVSIPMEHPDTYTLTLTEANFSDTVSGAITPILVDFWAEWCGPCRSIAPILEDLAADFSERLCIGKLDVDAHPGVAQRYLVRSIPTLLLFVDGEPVLTLVGALSRHELEKALKPHLDYA